MYAKLRDATHSVVSERLPDASYFAEAFEAPEALEGAVSWSLGTRRAAIGLCNANDQGPVTYLALARAGTICLYLDVNAPPELVSAAVVHCLTSDRELPREPLFTPFHRGYHALFWRHNERVGRESDGELTTFVQWSQDATTVIDANLAAYGRATLTPERAEWSTPFSHAVATPDADGATAHVRFDRGEDTVFGLLADSLDAGSAIGTRLVRSQDITQAASRLLRSPFE